MTAEYSINDTQREIAAQCDAIKELLLQKNAAYGDSAMSPMRVFSRADSVEQIKVRIDDKISRLSRGHAIPDETLEATVDDLIGYLVLLKIAQNRRHDEKALDKAIENLKRGSGVALTSHERGAGEV